MALPRATRLGKHSHRAPRNKAEAMRRSQQNAQSILFTLPQELRDMVYKLVLISGEINIKGKEAAPPAIAHTCRFLRNEALPIFCENKFFFKINNYDVRKWVAWDEMYGSIDGQLYTPPIFVTFGFCDSSVHLSQTKLHLMYLLENGIKDNISVLEVDWFDGEGTSSSNSVNVRMANLLQKTRVMKEQGLTWEQAKVKIGLAVNAAMVCGERDK